MPFDLTPPLKTRETAGGRVLAKAKRLLSNPDRWTQGAYKLQGRYCLVGAILANSWLRPRARREAFVALYQAVYGPTLWISYILDPTAEGERGSIIAFNDRFGTSHDDVLRALEDARIIANQAFT